MVGIANTRETLIIILIVVLIGTPIVWAIEGNEVESMNVDEVKNRIHQITGYTIEKLGGKTEEELEDILDSISLDKLNFDETKAEIQTRLNDILYERLPNGEGKKLYIKGWNVILDKINPVDSIPNIFANIFDGLMEFTLRDVFKTDFNFPKLAGYISG